MACDRFTGALKDHALGAPLAADAAAHLAVCGRCQELLAREHELGGLIDLAIAGVGSVQPSTDFAVRARAVAAATIAAPVPAGGLTWPLVAGLAAAAVLALAVALWPQGQRQSGAPMVASVATDIVLRATPPPLASRTSASRVRSAAAMRPALTQNRMPEVLVPHDQARGIARLVRAFAAKNPGLVAWNAAPAAAPIENPPVVEALVVQDIALASIAVPAPIAQD